MNFQNGKRLRTAHLQTPTDLKAEDVREISGALNVPLAEVFAFYLNTKNFYLAYFGSALPRLSFVAG